MHTNDLISLLAHEPMPVSKRTLLARWSGFMLLGVGVSLALLLWGWQLNPKLESLAQTTAFWVKLAWLAALALAAGAGVWFASQPLGSLRLAAFVMATAIVSMLALAAGQLSQADATTRTGLLMGSTWNACLWSIAALSVPILAASLWLMRAMAPVQTLQAGAAAGCFAGVVSALLYSLHCPETAYPFVLLWYSAGIAISTATGAILGLRLLRW